MSPRLAWIGLAVATVLLTAGFVLAARADPLDLIVREVPPVPAGAPFRVEGQVGEGHLFAASRPLGQDVTVTLRVDDGRRTQTDTVVVRRGSDGTFRSRPFTIAADATLRLVARSPRGIVETSTGWMSMAVRARGVALERGPPRASGARAILIDIWYDRIGAAIAATTPPDPAAPGTLAVGGFDLARLFANAPSRRYAGSPPVALVVAPPARVPFESLPTRDGEIAVSGSIAPHYRSDVLRVRVHDYAGGTRTFVHPFEAASEAVHLPVRLAPRFDDGGVVRVITTTPYRYLPHIVVRNVLVLAALVVPGLPMALVLVARRRRLAAWLSIAATVLLSFAVAPAAFGAVDANAPDLVRELAHLDVALAAFAHPVAAAICFAFAVLVAEVVPAGPRTAMRAIAAAFLASAVIAPLAARWDAEVAGAAVHPAGAFAVFAHFNDLANVPAPALRLVEAALDVLAAASPLAFGVLVTAELLRTSPALRTAATAASAAGLAAGALYARTTGPAAVALTHTPFPAAALAVASASAALAVALAVLGVGYAVRRRSAGESRPGVVGASSGASALR